jgi:hypothetical protein
MSSKQLNQENKRETANAYRNPYLEKLKIIEHYDKKGHTKT